VLAHGRLPAWPSDDGRRIGRLAHSDSNEAHTAEANNTDEAATATATATIKQTSA
jgi:hypothetical protein